MLTLFYLAEGDRTREFDVVAQDAIILWSGCPGAYQDPTFHLALKPQDPGAKGVILSVPLS